VDFCSKYVFEPAGVDTTIYNATADPEAMATFGYASSSDTRPGFYPGEQPANFVVGEAWTATFDKDAVKKAAAKKKEDKAKKCAATGSAKTVLQGYLCRLG
jgi:hypothetical protein